MDFARPSSARRATARGHRPSRKSRCLQRASTRGRKYRPRAGAELSSSLIGCGGRQCSGAGPWRPSAIPGPISPGAPASPAREQTTSLHEGVLLPFYVAGPPPAVPIQSLPLSLPRGTVFKFRLFSPTSASSPSRTQEDAAVLGVKPAADWVSPRAAEDSFLGK